MLIFCVEQTEYDALVAISSRQKSPTIKMQIAECNESIWNFIKKGWEEYRYEPWVALLEEKRHKEKPGVSEGTIMVRKLSTHAKDQASKVKPVQAAGSVCLSMCKKKAPKPKAVESEEEMDIDEDAEGEEDCYRTASCLISSHLINTSVWLCYGTAPQPLILSL